MEILGVHHVGKVVADLEAELDLLEKLGWTIEARDLHDEHQKVKIGLARNGDMLVEVLVPDGPDSPIANTTPGLNHLCFVVESIEAYIAEVTEKGLGFQLTKPTESVFDGRKVAFFSTKNRDVYEVIERD